MLIVTNLTRASVNDKFLNSVAAATLRRIKRAGEISLVLIGDIRMRRLNKKYRGNDKTTDVLAFAEREEISPAPLRGAGRKRSFVPPETSNFIGEVLISVLVAKKQARHQKHSFEQELAALLVHGILHICGYDHERSEEDSRVMMGLQEEIISKLKS